MDIRIRTRSDNAIGCVISDPGQARQFALRRGVEIKWFVRTGSSQAFPYALRHRLGIILQFGGGFSCLLTHFVGACWLGVAARAAGDKNQGQKIRTYGLWDANGPSRVDCGRVPSLILSCSQDNPTPNTHSHEGAVVLPSVSKCLELAHPNLGIYD